MPYLLQEIFNETDSGLKKKDTEGKCNCFNCKQEQKKRFRLSNESFEFEAIPPDTICPEPAQMAKDRCLNPGTKQCPAIPSLLCVRGVNGIPFEYPNKIQKDSGSGLYVITDRQKNRLQKFTPPVRDALNIFINNMDDFGLTIEAIITYGSLYCRCISGTDSLSNHSFGDAIDVVGVRWAGGGTAGGKLNETIVHNYKDPGQRALLRRINACLRLSFKTVIDYHRSDHRDHFHCDLNRGGGRLLKGNTTVWFVQEALNIIGYNLVEDGEIGTNTYNALHQFSGRTVTELKNNASILNSVYDELFTMIAQGYTP